jgi:hypothetical protein
VDFDQAVKALQIGRSEGTGVRTSVWIIAASYEDQKLSIM